MDEVEQAPEDARFFLNWLDQLSLALRGRDRIPTEELRKHVYQQMETARSVYAKLAK